MECISNLESKELQKTIREVVEERYALGKLTRVKEILGGFCNRSYAVGMSTGNQTQQYFLRLYNPNIVPSEILFEHALLEHLKSNGFTLAAAIIACRDGSTLVRTPASASTFNRTGHWALFEFLAGEDRYTWTDTDLTKKELTSAADILARLHSCGRGFVPPSGASRIQPRIMDFLPTFKHRFSTFLNQAGGHKCDRLLAQNYRLICEAVDEGLGFGSKFNGMPELPIHCDYHPGNLKYRDEEGVGIFDFDWSKIDYRLFDVALGLIYFTAKWNKSTDGLKRKNVITFLVSYDARCHQLNQMDSLTQQEKKCLGPMLAIANLFLLNWCLVDFFSTPDMDDDEYHGYIAHNIGLIHWLRANAETLAQWIDSALGESI